MNEIDIIEWAWWSCQGALLFPFLGTRLTRKLAGLSIVSGCPFPFPKSVWPKTSVSFFSIVLRSFLADLSVFFFCSLLPIEWIVWCGLRLYSYVRCVELTIFPGHWGHYVVLPKVLFVSRVFKKSLRDSWTPRPVWSSLPWKWIKFIKHILFIKFVE